MYEHRIQRKKDHRGVEPGHPRHQAKVNSIEVSASAALNATIAIVHAGEIVTEFDGCEIVVNLSYDADLASVENSSCTGCDFYVIADTQGRGALDASCI